MEERKTPFPRSMKEYPSDPINKQTSGSNLDKQLPGHSGPSQIDVLRQAISQVEMLQEKKRSCEQMINTAEGNFRTITNSSRMSTKSMQKAFSSGIEYHKGNLDELAALLQGPTTLLDQFQNISKEHSRKKEQLNQKTEQLRKQFENLAKTTNNPKDFGTIEAELEKLQQQKNKLDTQREAVQEGIAKDSFEAQDEILKNICAKRIKNSYRMAHRVDLCFMFDGTGSMTQWIGLTRDTIDRIIATARQAYPDISFFFAVIVYRDVKTLKPDKTGYFDGSPSEILPFTDNISSVTRFLEGIRTYRNCDSAEDMNLGFQKTLKDLEWTSPTKILIHIADSPCHGSQFGSTNDNYPDGLPTDKPWIEIFRELKTLAIDYYFLAIRKTKTAQMFEEFNKIWQKSGVYAGGEKKKSVIASEDIHELNADDFVKKITASLLDSVKRTLSYLSSVSSMGLFTPEINTNFDAIIHDDEENKKDDLEDIEWNVSSNWKKVKGNIISVNEITIEKLLAGKWKTAKSTYTLSIRNKPFAKGAFSYAYPAKLEKLDCQLVAKKPLAGDIELDKAHQDQELEKNAIALSVVQAFNQDIKSCRGLQWCLVDYLPTFIFNGNNCTYMVEGYLGRDFTKYSNNLDAVSETQDIRHLTALAHYCFMKTNEQYLITDFQGSQKRLLTDPVIHSRTQKFHKTGDLGYEGIITFFSRHKCNAVCQALRLQMPKSIQKIKDLPAWKDKIDPPDSMPEKKEKCKSKLCTSLIENPKYVFCKACHNLMKESTIQKKCQDCPNNFETSSYFYVFMGLKQTRRCKTCRDKRKK